MDTTKIEDFMKRIDGPYNGPAAKRLEHFLALQKDFDFWWDNGATADEKRVLKEEGYLEMLQMLVSGAQSMEDQA